FSKMFVACAFCLTTSHNLTDPPGCAAPAFRTWLFNPRLEGDTVFCFLNSAWVFVCK
ncbi:mCG1027185, partial [Mus musculus]